MQNENENDRLDKRIEWNIKDKNNKEGMIMEMETNIKICWH